MTRDSENWIRRMSMQDAFINLYHSSVRKLTNEQLLSLMDIIDTLSKRVPIYQMGCTPTIEAAQMAYNAMKDGV